MGIRKILSVTTSRFQCLDLLSDNLHPFRPFHLHWYGLVMSSQCQLLSKEGNGRSLVPASALLRERTAGLQPRRFSDTPAATLRKGGFSHYARVQGAKKCTYGPPWEARPSLRPRLPRVLRPPPRPAHPDWRGAHASAARVPPALFAAHAQSGGPTVGSGPRVTRCAGRNLRRMLLCLFGRSARVRGSKRGVKCQKAVRGDKAR